MRKEDQEKKKWLQDFTKIIQQMSYEPIQIVFECQQYTTIHIFLTYISETNNVILRCKL